MKSEARKLKFQWDAGDYARHSGAQQLWARELLAHLNLKGDEALLDIGCGDGKVTAEIASVLAAGRVVGLDSSEEMVALARDRYPFNAFPNLSFCRQDARALSFDREFDVIFSNAALHWVLDQRPVLSGMYRALKPGGRVLVQMGGKGNAAQVIAAVEELLQEAEWKEFFQGFSFPYGFYSPEAYAPWLQEAGLVVDRIELKSKALVHENIDQFKGWFRTTWLPYIERVPVELRNMFIDALAERYLQQNPADPNGAVMTRMQRLEYLARK